MCFFVEIKKKVCVSGPKGHQKNRPVMPLEQDIKTEIRPANTQYGVS